jgi:hypothetical protein
MCAMVLIPTSSQYIDRVFLYLTQKNHLEGFRLSHRCTLAGSQTPAYGSILNGQNIIKYDLLNLVTLLKRHKHNNLLVPIARDRA